MVGAIKRWLGIDALERENLTLAYALKEARRRIGELQSGMDRLRNTQEALAEKLDERLTAEPEKPKIIAKPPAPKRVNWRQAREALEKASDMEDEQ